MMRRIKYGCNIWIDRLIYLGAILLLVSVMHLSNDDDVHKSNNNLHGGSSKTNAIEMN